MPSRMRSRPSSRVTQPWSMAMQMAVMPKPWAAMLQGDPAWLRSLIRPLTGLASFQKYSKAVCCRLSSRASVVRPIVAPVGVSRRSAAAVGQGGEHQPAGQRRQGRAQPPCCPSVAMSRRCGSC